MNASKTDFPGTLKNSSSNYLWITNKKLLNIGHVVDSLKQEKNSSHYEKSSPEDGFIRSSSNEAIFNPLKNMQNTGFSGFVFNNSTDSALDVFEKCKSALINLEIHPYSPNSKLENISEDSDKLEDAKHALKKANMQIGTPKLIDKDKALFHSKHLFKKWDHFGNGYFITKEDRNELIEFRKIYGIWKLYNFHKTQAA